MIKTNGAHIAAPFIKKSLKKGKARDIMEEKNGCVIMPGSEKRKKWEKENTVFIGVKLQKSTDARLLSYLEGKAKQTVIKAALNEYIDRHPDAGQYESGDTL